MADSKTNNQNRLIKFLAPTVAILWACFQLILPQFVILDRIQIRSIHLTFALVLVFLAFPARRRKGKNQFCVSQTTPMMFLNWTLGIIAALSALYLVLD